MEHAAGVAVSACVPRSDNLLSLKKNNQSKRGRERDCIFVKQIINRNTWTVRGFVLSEWQPGYIYLDRRAGLYWHTLHRLKKWTKKRTYPSRKNRRLWTYHIAITSEAADVFADNISHWQVWTSFTPKRRLTKWKAAEPTSTLCPKMTSVKKGKQACSHEKYWHEKLFLSKFRTL